MEPAQATHRGVCGRRRRGIAMTQGGVSQRTLQTNCIHHWVIEPPSGSRESRGTCKHCGKTKVFANSTENVMWEQTNTVRNDLRSALRIKRREDMLTDDED